QSMVQQADGEQVIIEGSLTASELKQYEFHQDLIAFRPASKQYEAVLKISDFPEGRIIIARTKDTIIGYVTYLYPDPLDRWSTFNMKDFIDLCSIEFIPAFSSVGINSIQL